MVNGTASSEESDAETGNRLPAELGGARWIRSQLAAGVVALTTVAADAFRAATLTACLNVSLDPPLFLVSIELDGQMDGWLLQSGVYALSVLPWNEQFLADQFAGRTPLASPNFTGIAHFIAETGSPILRNSTAWVDCLIEDSRITGDHRCFIGRAVAMGFGFGAREDPLIHHQERFRRIV
jgi:flavin reductase (DIM6/NTAB) family NADH-FMN oxidoreductase RutF